MKRICSILQRSFKRTLFVLFFLHTYFIFSQTIIPVGASQTYQTISAAYSTGIPASISTSYVIQLNSDYAPGGEVFPITLGSKTGASSANTITIRPNTGAGPFTISGNNATAIFYLDGANYVILDGRQNGAGSTVSLTISNANVAGSTITFINDASNNTLKYCEITGVTTAAGTSGVVFFSTASSTGNDYNTIDYCNIHDGTTTPYDLIFSEGSVGNGNDFNTVSNCNLYNFYVDGSTPGAIDLGSDNSDWTISGNSIYQTVARAPAAVQSGLFPIWISSGSNFIISGNFIGGRAPNCGGAALTFGSNQHNTFYGIFVNTATTSACFIQNNTIANISYSSRWQAASANSLSFVGLVVSAGYVNLTDNIIGSATGNGSINITYSATSTQTFNCGGILSNAVQGTVSNNIFGSFTVGGGNVARAGNIRAIECDGALSADFTISNNIIGSTTTTNSIQYSPSSAVANSITGIFTGVTGATRNLYITDNTISNITNNTTGAGGTTGITMPNTCTSLVDIIGNTIANMKTTAPVTSGLIGINAANLTQGQVISNNIIHDNSHLNAGAGAYDNIGIYYSGPVAGTNTISGNSIYNLTLSSTAVTASIYGIQIASGIATTSNNMITLGNGIATGYIIYGIYQASNSGGSKYYFNSIYIGGAVAGGSSTSCYYYSVNSNIARTFYNNIFFNNRSGGGTTHYCIWLRTKGNLCVSNYNNLRSTSGNIARINATNYATIAAWGAIALVGDANSINNDPSFVAPAAATPDLHIILGSPVIAVGWNGTGVANDFDNDLRSSTPDMGADEYHTNYYSKATGNLELTATWGINTDGSGANPPNFTTRNCNFNIRNNLTPTIGAAWTVSGSGSIVILGDGTNACNYIIPQTFVFTGTINILNKGMLTNQNAANPTLNVLDAGSTVNYNSADGVNQTVFTPITYGNLILSNSSGTGSTIKTLAANITGIVGDLTISDYTTFNMVTFNSNRTGGGGTLTLAANSTLRLSGTTGGASANNNFPNNFSIMTVNSTSTVEYYGATQTIYNIPTYGNLTITTAGNKTVGGNMTIGGNLFINTGTLVGSTFTINIAGNWTNNLAFTQNTSTVHFNGSVAQSVSGSVFTTFNNLRINNTFSTPDQITLNSNITVGGLLTMNRGIVNPNGRTFILAAGATSTIGNAASYVNGPLNYIKASAGATALNFPVGKGNSWNPFLLNPTHSNATSVTYTGEVINSSAMDLGYALPGTIDHVSYERYWQIDRQVVANLTNATVTLYYNSTDGVTDCNNLTVAKTTGSGTPWIDIGGSGQCDGFGNPSGSLISGLFTSFSKFSLANKTGGTNPLPIELLSFTAVYNSGNVDLDWKTSSETNNDYFTIEKSKDANVFSEVFTIKGAGNSHSVLHYSAIDKEPYSGLSYYRLRQTDYDGKFTISNIVPINITKPNSLLSFEVFPNPISKEESPSINISSFEPQAEVIVVVRDLLGQELYSKVIMTDFSGNSVTAIDLENNLSAGTYLIIGTSLNQTFNKYLIIK